MSDSNRIVWSEGLFLRPQHFQQQERYLEGYVQGRAASLRSHSWGLTQFEIERDLLAIGKVGLRRARGVFPDGTPFEMPDNDPLPTPIEIGALRDQMVSLAVPLRKPGAAISTRTEDGAKEMARHRPSVHQARDVMSELGTSADIEVAALSARLMTQTEPPEGFAQIPLLQVIECRADKQVLLNEQFIPTVLACAAAPRLRIFLTELQGVLHQSGEALAALAVASGRGGAAEIADFLMLQSINRYEPVVTHLAVAAHCHPEDLYRLLLEMLGDLSTLTTSTRRPVQLAPYRHEALQATFDPLIRALLNCLAKPRVQLATPIPLNAPKFGIRVGNVIDRTLFDSAVFVLAARADMPSEEFRRRFPQQIKIGPVEQIRDLVMKDVSGIALEPMAVAPRQIPFHAGFSYFELERGTDLWQRLKTSGGVAIHQAGEFPGLAMEFWAIRSAYGDTSAG
jgi:type VI secretion system protein ImpJ